MSKNLEFNPNIEVIFFCIGYPLSGKTTILNHIKTINSNVEVCFPGVELRKLSLNNLELANSLKKGLAQAEHEELVTSILINILNNTTKKIIFIDGFPRIPQQLDWINNCINPSYKTFFAHYNISEEITNERLISTNRAAERPGYTLEIHNKRCLETNIMLKLLKREKIQMLSINHTNFNKAVDELIAIIHNVLNTK